MKKFLVVMSLMLAIITSLTAGTMAAYTTQVAPVSDNVIAKKFSISVDKSRTSSLEGAKIGPGDTLWYKMTIANDSTEKDGISADIDVTAEITGELAKVCKVEMFRNNNEDRFEDTDKKAVKTVLAERDGYATKVGIQFNNVGLKVSEKNVTDVSRAVFYLKITWPYSDDPNANQTDSLMVLNNDGTVRDEAAKFNLEININAVSHNVHQVVGLEGKTMAGTSMDLVRGRVYALEGALA